MQLVLFNPKIGPYQVLPFRARVDLGAMAMKGCSAFPKAPASLVLYCHLQIHARYILTQWITDARNDKDAGKLLYKNMFLSLYCKGSKRVTQGLRVRRSWRSNITAIYWPPLLWPSTLCLSLSPGLLNRRPRAHSAECGFLYSILSASSLDPNSSGPQAPSAWCGFPYHTRLQLAATQLALDFRLDCVI